MRRLQLLQSEAGEELQPRGMSSEKSRMANGQHVCPVPIPMTLADITN